MRSNIYVNFPQFASAELRAAMLSNFFMSKTRITRNKIVSDSPNNACNISMDEDIIFKATMLEVFRPGSEV